MTDAERLAAACAFLRQCVCGHSDSQHHSPPNRRCRACVQCPAFTPLETTP